MGFDSEGKRNIGSPRRRRAARQLTRSNTDDGQELSDLVFSPNGSAIAYVRGQGKNQAGEVPNPTSDPTGAKQQVLVVDTRTGRVTTIGEGSSPLFNAAGDQVIYIRDGKFWTAPVIGGRERKLFEIRGTVNSPQWSPNGAELAFVSNRGDHSFIGIYDTRSNYLRFMSPSVDRDEAPPLVAGRTSDCLHSLVQYPTPSQWIRTLTAMGDFVGSTVAPKQSGAQAIRTRFVSG